MTIHLSLSTESINAAIRKLADVQETLDNGTEQLVEILTNEGAEIAQAAYGSMAVASGEPNGKTGVITGDGDDVLIAEFGAGDGVIPVKFENSPMTPVYAGSYSEQHAKQYSRWGFWYFGGQVYSDIPARHGLLDAKRFIIENSTDIAREVIQFD